jgi:hypothetical protein
VTFLSTRGETTAHEASSGMHRTLVVLIASVALLVGLLIGLAIG